MEEPDVLRFAQAQHDEPVAGFIRQVKLGASGVLLIAGESQLLVPISELFALAQSLDSGFTPPAAVARGRGGAKA